MKVKYIKKADNYINPRITLEKVYEATLNECGNYDLIDDKGWSTACFDYEVEVIDNEKDTHYNNTNGSLYLFANQHELNAYEFDILKRIVRCRKKGQFREDLEKTIRVIELYLKEME